MRVVCYHPWIYLRSGVERMLVELVRRSRHDWVLATHHFEPDATYPELAALDVRVLTPEIEVRRRAGPISQAAWTIARTDLTALGADALLVSSEGLGDLVLTRTRLPTVAYCHTPLKIIHDPVTRDRLAERDRVASAMSRVLGPVFTAVDRALWRRYRHAFVNSAEVQDRLARARLRPSGPVEVLHPGVDRDRFVPARAPTPRRGFVVAGRIMWQKRIELAIDAYRQVVASVAEPEELVVAGTVDVKSEPYLAELRARAHGLPVRFEVGPSDAQVVELLQQSRALVFTAPNEDFGMVLLEALACGTPVLAPDRGGPREIVTPDTGWLVADDAPTYAAHLRDLLAAPDPGRWRDGAVARAAEFGWDAFVTRIDAVLDQVAHGQVAQGRP